MRKLIAIFVAKTLRGLSRALKQGGGTTLPGLIAEKICPDIIHRLSKNIPNGVIVITGTNGKTTTAKMLAAILAQSGEEVIYNFAGSNLSRGVASILIEHTNIFGTKVKGSIAVFEVDEATMPEIGTKLLPTLVLVTNLFRDQLDRYGELDKTASIIGSALKMMPRTKVLLNADDPLVASLSEYASISVYFGLEDKFTTRSTGAIDSKDCLSCGHELIYKPRYFGHLGKYSCPNCGLTRPELDYSLHDINPKVDSSKANFYFGADKKEILVQIPGIYNLYNALSAAAIAAELKVAPGIIAHALANVTAAFGRMEKIKIGNKNVFILLVKNPTGFTQALETLTFDNKPKNLMFALNDNFADGTDISWIWDAEIEIIKDLTKSVHVSGIRAEDLLLRVKYAGFKTQKPVMQKDLEKAFDGALANVSEGETLYILPTYTAMLEIRKILKNRGLVKGLLE